MTSNFNDVFASGTVTADIVVCNSFITNQALSSTEFGGTLTKTNVLRQFSGNTITISGTSGVLNLVNMNVANVYANANLTVNGNLKVNDPCLLHYSNVASQTQIVNNPQSNFLDFYSHSNVANVTPDVRIASLGGDSNIIGNGICHINSKSMFIGATTLSPFSGEGNLVVNYNSANITNDLYCNSHATVERNITGKANLQINGNATIVGNISVGNISIGSIRGNTDIIGNEFLVKATNNNNGFVVLPNSASGTSNNFVTQINMLSGNVTSTYSPFFSDAYIRCNRGEVTGTAIGEGNVEIFCNNLTLGRTRTTNNVNVLSQTLQCVNLTASGTSTFNGNAIATSNFTVRSDGNIDNALTIRSGFKGGVATNRYVTYDIPVSGVHYFWDDVEVTGNIVVGNDISYNTISPAGYRSIYAYGQLGLAASPTATIGTGTGAGNVSCVAPIMGTLTQVNTQTWNASTFGNFGSKLLKVTLVLKPTTAINFTLANYAVFTSASSSMSSAVQEVTRFHARNYTTPESIVVDLTFVLPSARPYFYFIAAINPGMTYDKFNSSYLIEEVLCR